MSKAFTKEDGAGEDVPLPLRPRAAEGSKRPITPEGYRALQEELAALTTPAQDEDGEARGRERTRRAQQLSTVLDAVQVVEPPQEPERVAFGVWVTLEDEDGAEVRYRLVGSDEADARAGRLSVESPVARALLGREVGDSVVVELPRGSVEYTVLQVSTEH